MSIVEKAVGRVPAGKSRLRPADRSNGRGEEKLPAAQPAISQEQLVASQLYVLEHDPVAAKEFRFLKRPVMARVFGASRSGGEAGHVLMITSDLPQVGKSFMAINLAASIAQEKLIHVVLVDADAIRRTLSERLGIADRPGMIDLLADDQLQPEDVLLDTALPGLQVLPAGGFRPNATELFASRRAEEILGMLQARDTVVILDTPPLLPTSEARAAIDKVDHALVVIEAGRSTTGELETMLKTLGQSRASVSLILNKSPRSSRTPQLYSYDY